MALLGPPECF
jgi:hypothetical protein